MKKQLSEIFKKKAGNYFVRVDYSTEENRKKIEKLKEKQKEIMDRTHPSLEALNKIVIIL